MAPNLPIDVATFTGLVCFALLYGVFVTLFFMGLYVLIRRRNTARLNWPFLCASVLLFLIITTALIIRWDRCQAAFITHGGTPGGSIAFIEDLSDWREVSSTALWAALSATGDIMMIYRLYMVWNKSWQICIGPVILLIGSLTTGIGLLVILSQPITTAYAVNLYRWVLSFLSCNLAQNVLVTTLICVRIWSINIESTGLLGSSTLWPVIIVLCESGALYSSSVMIFLATYAAESNAAYVMTDISMPIMGITFMLIIVRVGLGMTKSRSNMDPSAPYASASAVRTGNRSKAYRSNNGMTSSLAYPMQNIQVSMTQDVKTDGDDLEALDGRSKDDEEVSVDKNGVSWA